jgi:AcrR family transcriptional regulator
MNDQPPSVKDRLHAVASDLFYRHGYRAVGLEQILTEAKVAKGSFYHYFKSKDDLVVDYLSERREKWLAHLRSRVDALAFDPKSRPKALIEVMCERIAMPEFRGCGFANAMIEIADRTHPIHRVVTDTKEDVRAFIETCLRDAGLEAQSQALSAQLMIIFDGAMVHAALNDPATIITHTRNTANLVLTSVESPQL